MSAPRSTRSLGRASLVLAAVGSAVALVAWSSISPDLILGFVAVALIGVAALLGTLHLIIGITRRTVPAASIVAAGVVIISGILISTGIPFAARWEASEASFTEYADTAPSQPSGGGDVIACPTRLGLFRIKSCYPAYGTFLYTDRTGTFLGDSGFARRPAGAPLTIRHGDVYVTFRPLGGGWYAFTRAYG